MNEAERILLQTTARVILDGDAGPLDGQLSRLDADPVRVPRFVPIEQPSADGIDPVRRPSDLQFDNGTGGFTPDGREYVIHLTPRQWTPATLGQRDRHPTLRLPHLGKRDGLQLGGQQRGEPAHPMAQ